MARQIVIQPNGLYAMWSTIIDDFIKVDLTRDQYIEYRAKESYEDKKKEMTEMFNDIEDGDLCYTLGYNEAIEKKKFADKYNR